MPVAGLRPRSSCADSADWRPTLLEEGCPELTLEDCGWWDDDFDESLADPGEW